MDNSVTPAILADIKAAILITLEADGPASAKSLTEAFQDSGEPTKHAWVLQAARELKAEGHITVRRGTLSLMSREDRIIMALARRGSGPF